MSLLSRAGIAGAALRRAMSSSAAPVRVGIIGAGRIGQVHAKAITAMHGAEVAAIADPFEKFGVAAAETFNTKYIPNWEDLLSDETIDGIVIGSPTPFHAEQIVKSAEAGKAIMCEKPISNDLATIDKCLDVVEKTNARLLIGFQRRFDANFMEVSKQVTDGVIGEVRMFQINSRDPAPPPAEYLANSGGIFLDMMSHDFDQARFCTGAEIEEVFVAGKAFEEAAQQADDLDTVIVMLKMSNGAIGTIGNSRRCAYGYDQRIEVFGSDGMLSSNNRTPHTVNISNESSVSSPLPYSFFMDRYALAYSGVMEAFVKMIREGTPPPVTGADGRAPIVAAMAANKSIKEGRPVRLAEVDITDASAQSAQA
ncbi:inositol 2-dehydrogenase [Gracilaria domingensis]|nr:inositol 2-dehydrogenase [Gracilaria domingensis]